MVVSLDNLFFDGVLEDVKALGLTTLVDTCQYRVHARVRNRQGNVTETFLPAVELPCRMDAMVNRLVPQRSKDDIEVQKILKTFYLDADDPHRIDFKPSDELDSDAGNPGVVTTYIVLDVAIETQLADIVLLVEVKLV